MKHALIQQISIPAKRLWSALAAHQNMGFFTRRALAQVPTSGNPQVRLPQGLDLRASGPGFHNQPAHLALLVSGEAFLQVSGTTIVLGTLAQRFVESGWIVTGLRLRGALRFPEQQVVLMVPDREDLPYLLQVLAPCMPSSLQAQPQYMLQAA